MSSEQQVVEANNEGFNTSRESYGRAGVLRYTSMAGELKSM